MAKRNPPWTREELILSLNLFFKTKPSKFTSSNPDIIELSNTLRKLSAFPNPPDIETYRNPNGVAKKLSNFLRFDPTYEGTGLTRGGKLEEKIWEEFAGSRLELESAAKKIISNIDQKVK